MADLSKDQMICLAGLCALCLPDDDLALGSWNLAILGHVVDFLGLPDKYRMSFEPLIPGQSDDPGIKTLQKVAFLKSFMPPDRQDDSTPRLPGEHYERLSYLALRDIVVMLSAKCLYDARARAMIRRLAFHLNVRFYDVMLVEAYAALHLHDIWEISHAKEKEQNTHKKAWRYAKIGGAAIAGGTILALTGGLAAPAIAVGLSAIGTGATSLAATFATSTTIGALFGASGAGLVGYKMKRRTQGVKQFEFVKEGSKEDTRMCLCICVSGWLVQDEADFQLPWGREATKMALERRLRIFYSRYNPAKVAGAANVAKDFAHRQDELDRACRAKYGASPFDRRVQVLTRDPSLPELGEEEKLAINNILDQFALDRTVRKRAGSRDERAEQQRMDEAMINEIVNMGIGKRAAKAASGGRNEGTSTPSTAPLDTSCDPLSSQEPLTPISQCSRSDSLRDSPSISERSGRGGGDDDESATEGSSSEIERQEGESGPLRPLPARPRLTKDGDNNDSSWEGVDTLSPWWEQEFPLFDHYTLHWESEALKALGSSVRELVASLGQSAMVELLAYTTAATLISALAWPITLIQAADYIDGTWAVACERADRAGKLLADVLVKREHGTRPIVLMGYSMGARLIMSCLEELHRIHRKWVREQRRRGDEGQSRSPTSKVTIKESPVAGLIQSVVLMGAPVPCYPSTWRAARQVVADRLVNCYSSKDWMLSLVYRYQRVTLSAAGIHSVDMAGVEDIDCSSIIGGHQEYPTKIREVLRLVQLDDAVTLYSTSPTTTTTALNPDTIPPVVNDGL